MKVKGSPIEVAVEFHDTKYRVMPGINNLHQNLAVTPFVYGSQNPSIFKLVLSWIFRLNSAEPIIRATAEHEFIIELEENKTKERETIQNIIGTSEMNLESRIQDNLSKNRLGEYSFKALDYSETIEQILGHIRPE